MTDVGKDQFLPDDMDDTYGFNQGTSPGGDIENEEVNENQQNGHSQQNDQSKQQSQSNSNSNNPNNNRNGVIMDNNQELGTEQKLQLAERANEIYRQQLKYMQDHLASLRSLIQDKENIIENLMLRYDLGIITQDQNRQGGNLSSDEIEMEELRRKAEALAQRTILENFELREMVNELRDENFHLRNEIYELQDKINRQVLQINKLEKAQPPMTAGRDIGTEMDSPNMDDFDEEDEDMYEEEDAPSPMNNNEEYNDNNDDDDRVAGKEEYEQQHPQGRRQSFDMDHPANTQEAMEKRVDRANHERKPSEATPNIFDEADESGDEEDYMTAEDYKTREERQKHQRKESAATPNMFGDMESPVESDEDNPRGTKRRGSITNDTSDYMDDEAIKRKEERKKKAHHRKKSSIAPPPLFEDNYDPEKYAAIKAKKFTPQAVEKRQKRRANKLAKAASKYVHKHRRKESLAEKLLLGPTEYDDFNIKAANPEERAKLQKKAREEQRRKSRQMIQMQVGDKGHLSDDDFEVENTEKPKRYNYKNLRKGQGNSQQDREYDGQEVAQTNGAVTNTKKRPSVSGVPAVMNNIDEEKTSHHRRDSSAPVVPLGFEDPDVLLHFEKLKVKDLEAELEKQLNKIDDVKSELDKYKEQVDSAKKQSDQSTKNKNKIENELDDAVQSKSELAQKCAMEIMRLTMILNTLLQIPKFNDIVQLLIDESYKASHQHDSPRRSIFIKPKYF